MNSPILIFDIETAPAEDGEPFDESEVALGNRKDPEKIKAYIDTVRSLYVQEASLSATTGKVLVIGWYEPGRGVYSALEGSEYEVISNFWRNINDAFEQNPNTRFVGFAILEFDLPFLIRRSWRLGIETPNWVFYGRYISPNFVDLLGWWRCGVRQDSISLDRFARFLRVGGKDRTGKDFHVFYEKDPRGALQYLYNDLNLCAKLAERLAL